MLLLILLLSLLVLNPIMVNAENYKVYDYADLLSEDEVISLNNEADNLSYNYDMDILIVTIDDAEGKSARDYADDFFDYNDFGIGDDRDGILFLIDMDNREAWISTHGDGIKYLTDYRIEKIIEGVVNKLGNEDFYGAAQVFLRYTEGYLEDGIPSNQHSKSSGLKLWQILVSVVIAAFSGGGFYLVVTNNYNISDVKKPMNFRNNSIVSMATREDRLVDTFVTRRTIKKDNDGDSGKSSTHTSSSGSSHGGGGGKF